MTDLIIRVATSPESGRGHLTRCLNIRKFINISVTWYTDFTDKYIISLIPKRDKIYQEKNKNSCDLLQKNNLKKNNILLIDSYHISYKKKEELMSNFKVVSIEDKKTDLKVNIVICPQPLVDSKKNIYNLIGLKYVPLFFQLNKGNNKKEKKIFTILVSFGGYDSTGITINAIKAIKKLKKNKTINFRAYVLVTRNFLQLRLIKKLIEFDKNFTLIIESKHIKSIIEKSTIAIGAPGVSQMERLALGLPSILVAQNSYQNNLIDIWCKKKCALKSKNTIKSINKNILDLVKNEKLRNKLAENGKKNVDGLGAKRIAEKINLL